MLNNFHYHSTIEIFNVELRYDKKKVSVVSYYQCNQKKKKKSLMLSHRVSVSEART